jgi:hypothetical protein
MVFGPFPGKGRDCRDKVGAIQVTRSRKTHNGINILGSLSLLKKQAVWGMNSGLERAQVLGSTGKGRRQHDEEIRKEIRAQDPCNYQGISAGIDARANKVKDKDDVTSQRRWCANEGS